MHPLWFQIGISGWRALGVVIAATVLNLVHMLAPEHLMTMLRRAGIHRVKDAELVIPEKRGSLTIVRAVERIDAALPASVDGRRLIPEALTSD